MLVLANLLHAFLHKAVTKDEARSASKDIGKRVYLLKNYSNKEKETEKEQSSTKRAMEREEMEKDEL